MLLGDVAKLIEKNKNYQTLAKEAQIIFKNTINTLLINLFYLGLILVIVFASLFSAFDNKTVYLVLLILFSMIDVTLGVLYGVYKHKTKTKLKQWSYLVNNNPVWLQKIFIAYIKNLFPSCVILSIDSHAELKIKINISQWDLMRQNETFINGTYQDKKFTIGSFIQGYKILQYYFSPSDSVDHSFTNNFQYLVLVTNNNIQVDQKTQYPVYISKNVNHDQYNLHFDNLFQTNADLDNKLKLKIVNKLYDSEWIPFIRIDKKQTTYIFNVQKVFDNNHDNNALSLVPVNINVHQNLSDQIIENFKKNSELLKKMIPWVQPWV